MDKKYVLITGSDGLVVRNALIFIEKGYSIIGIDNNYEKVFGKMPCSMEQRKKSLLKIITILI